MLLLLGLVWVMVVVWRWCVWCVCLIFGLVVFFLVDWEVLISLFGYCGLMKVFGWGFGCIVWFCWVF